MTSEGFEYFERRKLYRAFNYLIIKKLWKLIKNDYGEPVVNGKYDANNIYKALQLSKESLRTIMRREYTYNEKKILKHSIKVENQTGIPNEYLRGIELIVIPDFNMTIEKLEEIYSYKELYQSTRDNIKDNLEDKTEDEIRELANRAKKLCEYHRHKLKSDIADMKKYIKEINLFDAELNDALKKLISLDMGNIKDNKLYRILYFLKYSKKFDEFSVVTIDDVIKIMKNTGYNKLNNIGEETLKEYLAQLKKQVQLVEAIFVIEEDKKNNK